MFYMIWLFASCKIKQMLLNRTIFPVTLLSFLCLLSMAFPPTPPSQNSIIYNERIVCNWKNCTVHRLQNSMIEWLLWMTLNGSEEVALCKVSMIFVQSHTKSLKLFKRLIEKKELLFDFRYKISSSRTDKSYPPSECSWIFKRRFVFPDLFHLNLIRWNDILDFQI